MNSCIISLISPYKINLIFSIYFLLTKICKTGVIIPTLQLKTQSQKGQKNSHLVPIIIKKNNYRNLKSYISENEKVTIYFMQIIYKSFFGFMSHQGRKKILKKYILLHTTYVNTFFHSLQIHFISFTHRFIHSFIHSTLSIEYSMID